MQRKFLSVSVLVLIAACAQLAQAQPSRPTPGLTLAERGAESARPAPREKRVFIPMVVGVAVFASGYAASALFSVEMLAAEPYMHCSSCRFARRLWIPLVGPWLLYPHGEGSTGKAVFAVLGALQAVGLAVSVWGVVRFVHSGSSAPSERVGLSFTPLRAGGYGSLRVLW